MAKKWYAYIFKENIYGLGVQASTFIAGVLFTVIFPNLLGREGFGYFSLVTGVVSIMQVLSDLGTGTAALRFIPEGSKKGVAWKYFRLLAEWRVVLAVLASAVMFSGADLIAAAYSSPFLADGIRAGSFYLLSYSIFGFMDVVFVSAKKTRNSFLLNLVFHAGRIGLPLALFFFYRSDYIGALLGVAAASTVAVIAALPWLLGDPLLRGGKDGEVDLPVLKSYIAYGTLAYAAGMMIQWSDTLIIGVYRPIADVSIYRVAWLWATATAFLFPFSYRIFLSAHAYESEERSRKMFGLTMKYGFVFAFLMISGILLVAGQFLGFIYGDRYSGAYPVMAVLSLLTLENMLTTLASGLFMGKGNVKTPTRVSIVTGLAQVAALVALTPSMGVIGAAFGVAAVRVAAALVQSLLALRFISIRIPAAYVYKPALCGALCVALLLPLKGLTYSLPAALAYGTGAVVLYLAAAVALKAVDVKELLRILKGTVSG